jgi:Na+-transporting NADH:ubiquinone oxidoreductase subunit NqrB
MSMPRYRDPRFYQIAVLGLLLGYGVLGLDFGIRWQNACAIIVTALCVQYAATRLAGLQRFDPLSAMITSLSLTLLLRTDGAALAALGACIAIGSKFLIRIGGKHVFNPANLALVTLMLASESAWVSTGQWGSAALGAFAFACLGMLVLTRAKRAETTLGFLSAYTVAVFARALWLGDPPEIPLHQLQSGALLLFAFFMISDPKTTPDSAVGRWFYGAVVAGATVVIQFVFHEPAAAILALVISAPLVPLLDALAGGRAYRWDRPAGETLITSKGAQ